jgi:hypothetical protein
MGASDDFSIPAYCLGGIVFANILFLVYLRYHNSTIVRNVKRSVADAASPKGSRVYGAAAEGVKPAGKCRKCCRVTLKGIAFFISEMMFELLGIFAYTLAVLSLEQHYVKGEQACVTTGGTAAVPKETITCPANIFVYLRVFFYLTGAFKVRYEQITILTPRI